MLFVTRRAKMPLQAVFPLRDIKSCGTPENAVQLIYLKYGNTKQPELYAVQGQQEKSYLYIQKGHFVKNVSCGYKIVIIFPLLSRFGGSTMGTIGIERAHSPPFRTTPPPFGQE